MDKLTVISCLLFFTADAFAIVALSMPDWIVTSVGGIMILIMGIEYESKFYKNIRLFLISSSCIRMYTICFIQTK